MSAGLPAQEKSWLLEWAFLAWGTEKARDAGYPLGGDGLAWGSWEVALVSCTTRENRRRKGVSSFSLLQHSHFVCGDNVLAPGNRLIFLDSFAAREGM